MDCKIMFDELIDEYIMIIQDIYDELEYYFDKEEHINFCYKDGEIKCSTILNYIKNI